MKRSLVLLALLVLAAGAVFAQSHDITYTVTENAMFELVETGVDMNLNPTLPAQAGDPPGGTLTGSVHLYYTAIAATADFYINAALNSAMPAGATLTLVSTIATGGDGDRGITQTRVYDDTTFSYQVVTAIGSCYTDRTPADATIIDYTLDPAGYSGDTFTRTITYTMGGW